MSLDRLFTLLLTLLRGLLCEARRWVYSMMPLLLVDNRYARDYISPHLLEALREHEDRKTIKEFVAPE